MCDLGDFGNLRYYGLMSELHTLSLSVSLTPTHALAFCLSSCMCVALPQPSDVNTSHASNKALRLARVHPNYVEYYLEDTVVNGYCYLAEVR